MTEKRFSWEYSYYDSTGEIHDWKRKECLITDYLQKYEIVEWCQELNKIVDENEQLKTQLQNTSDQRDEFHHGARENANRVGQLEKENKELKQFKKSVFALINEKITFVNECEKNHNDIGMPHEYYRGADEILNLLKKELSE